MSAKTSTERTRAYRQRLAQQGQQMITVTVPDRAAERIRRLSREHDQPLGKVVEMGVLLAEVELSRRNA